MKRRRGAEEVKMLMGRDVEWGSDCREDSPFPRRSRVRGKRAVREQLMRRNCAAGKK